MARAIHARTAPLDKRNKIAVELHEGKPGGLNTASFVIQEEDVQTMDPVMHEIRKLEGVRFAVHRRAPGDDVRTTIAEVSCGAGMHPVVAFRHGLARFGAELAGIGEQFAALPD